MLYQDTLTGALHEVPDGQVYESEFAEYPYQMGEPVFDGLGNPVGFLPFIPKIAALASMAPQVKGLVGGLIRRAAPIAAAGIPGAAALQAARAAIPAAAAAIPAAAAGAALAARRVMPPGWIPRPNPYTGLHGRRIYMNCRLYPGPKGLVPASAAQATPGALPPGAVPPPGVPVVRRRRRRR